jgi:uncharacterized protein with PIN domain
MPKKSHQRLEMLIDKIVREKDRPRDVQRCPECNGQLHVRFEAYLRGNREMLGVQAWCDACGASIAVDYADLFPTWLSEQ